MSFNVSPCYSQLLHLCCANMFETFHSTRHLYFCIQLTPKIYECFVVKSNLVHLVLILDTSVKSPYVPVLFPLFSFYPSAANYSLGFTQNWFLGRALFCARLAVSLFPACATAPCNQRRGKQRVGIFPRSEREIAVNRRAQYGQRPYIREIIHLALNLECTIRAQLISATRRHASQPKVLVMATDCSATCQQG